MKKRDRERRNYNEHYSGRKWADLNNYDLTVETSLFGIETTAEMIIEAKRKSKVMLSTQNQFYRSPASIGLFL